MERYIHTYMHACIHTYIHTYVHTYIHTFIYIYIASFHSGDMSFLSHGGFVGSPSDHGCFNARKWFNDLDDLG